MAAPQPHPTRDDERLDARDAARLLGSPACAPRREPARLGSPVRATILHGVKTIEAMGRVMTGAPRARTSLASAFKPFYPWTAT
jgi:hypothetical protein